MFGPVEFLIDPGIVQSEIGAEIDRYAALGQRDGEFGRDAVGQGEKHRLGLFDEQVDQRLGKRQVTCPGVNQRSGKRRSSADWRIGERSARTG